jgi:hypothetical protein
VCPLEITTTSPAMGLTPPTHVDGLFQSPEVTETIGAAYIFPANARRMMQRAFNRFIESFGFSVQLITLHQYEMVTIFLLFF